MMLIFALSAGFVFCFPIFRRTHRTNLQYPVLNAQIHVALIHLICKLDVMGSSSILGHKIFLNPTVVTNIWYKRTKFRRFSVCKN